MLSCDFMISVVAHSINKNAIEMQLNLVQTETFQVRAHKAIKMLRLNEVHSPGSIVPRFRNATSQ